jgi:hypothetical protein
MRALHGRGTLRVPDIGREASRPYNKTIVLLTFTRSSKFPPNFPFPKGGTKEIFLLCFYPQECK